jgi:MFS transporter, SP family, arabinose:H+ symporter
MRISSLVIKSSFASALGGLLFGFDTAVIAGATHQLTNVYKLTPPLLGLTVSSALWGTVAGAIAAGYLGSRFGRRDSLRVMAVFYLSSALGCAFAWNWTSLILFRIIGGLGIGGSSVLAPMYIAELSPPRWRGRLVGLFQVNIVIGILLAYFSNLLIVEINLGKVEWRWMLGVAGFPALLFLMMLFFIPRSPRWLAMQNRTEEALAILRLTSGENAERELRDITDSIHLERASAAEPLFQKKYTLVILLAVTAGAFNQLTGVNACLYYLNDIFVAAGASKYSSGVQSVMIGFINLIFTLIAMAVIDKLGRKRLLLGGTVTLCVLLTIIGFIFYTETKQFLLIWLLGAFIGAFAISQGAVVWVFISEVFPTLVRSKGQSLATTVLWVTNALISGVFPVLANISAAAPFFFFAVMMFADVLIIATWYPETRGLSLESLERRLEQADPPT